MPIAVLTIAGTAVTNRPTAAIMLRTPPRRFAAVVMASVDVRGEEEENPIDGGQSRNQMEPAASPAMMAVAVAVTAVS